MLYLSHEATASLRVLRYRGFHHIVRPPSLAPRWQRGATVFFSTSLFFFFLIRELYLCVYNSTSLSHYFTQSPSFARTRLSSSFLCLPPASFTGLSENVDSSAQLYLPTYLPTSEKWKLPLQLCCAINLKIKDLFLLYFSASFLHSLLIAFHLNMKYILPLDLQDFLL